MLRVVGHLKRLSFRRRRLVDQARVNEVLLGECTRIREGEGDVENRTCERARQVSVKGKRREEGEACGPRKGLQTLIS
jgi:hypothetical protein